MFFALPHVGIQEDGTLGKVRRPGQDAASAACGALVASLGELQTSGLKALQLPDGREALLPGWGCNQVHPQASHTRTGQASAEGSLCIVRACKGQRSGGKPLCPAALVGMICCGCPHLTPLCATEHDPDDVEYSILKKRLAQKLSQEGVSDSDIKSWNLAQLTKVLPPLQAHTGQRHVQACTAASQCSRDNLQAGRSHVCRVPQEAHASLRLQAAERTITRDLERLISKAVDSSKADYAVVTGVQASPLHAEGRRVLCLRHACAAASLARPLTPSSKHMRAEVHARHLPSPVHPGSSQAARDAAGHSCACPATQPREGSADPCNHTAHGQRGPARAGGLHPAGCWIRCRGWREEVLPRHHWSAAGAAGRRAGMQSLDCMRMGCLALGGPQAMALLSLTASAQDMGAGWQRMPYSSRMK